jgi:hypothetical protein
LSDTGGAKQALPVLHGLPPRSGKKAGQAPQTPRWRKINFPKADGSRERSEL